MTTAAAFGARQAYADELVPTDGPKGLRRAFATVPREDFLPAPWRLLTTEGGFRETSDPVELYGDILIAIDPERLLCNGSPALWARVFGKLAPMPGEYVVHIGTGTGYFTAILAEIVGTGGRVTGVEIDADLARATRGNLHPWPHADVRCADGSRLVDVAADVVVVNAGATRIQSFWLDAMRPGGRLYVPLTTTVPGSDFGMGCGFVVTRWADSFEARVDGPVMIFPCAGARDEESERALGAALARGAEPAARVSRLRTDAHDAGPACWCHVPGMCLSE